jgi:hypothetical protein
MEPSKSVPPIPISGIKFNGSSGRFEGLLRMFQALLRVGEIVPCQRILRLQGKGLFEVGDGLSRLVQTNVTQAAVDPGGSIAGVHLNGLVGAREGLFEPLKVPHIPDEEEKTGLRIRGQGIR